MSEYIDKAELVAAIKQRKYANVTCLNAGGESESSKYFQNLIFEDERIQDIIGELATVQDEQEYEYKVVRSYTPSAYYTGAEELEKCLRLGYEYVSESGVIQNDGVKPGYIEYILRRKK